MGSYAGDGGEVPLSHLVANLNINGSTGKLSGLHYPNPPLGLMASHDMLPEAQEDSAAGCAFDGAHFFNHPNDVAIDASGALMNGFHHPHRSHTGPPTLGAVPPHMYSSSGSHAFHVAMQPNSNGMMMMPEIPMPGYAENGHIGIDSYSFAAQQSLGWGGQAIQDVGTFKAPWFGKNRGRNGNLSGNHSNGYREHNGRNRGRGRGRNGNHGMSCGRHRRAPIANFDENSTEEVSVDMLIGLVQQVPNDQPLTDTVYRALFRLEGRSCALLLKELARSGVQRRAAEIFDWVRALEDGHPLRSLLDVYSYTAAISLCIAVQDVDRALNLANEMKSRGIERNVHTYTALMNVCIKCNRYSMALETYKLMRSDGCIPNVVTYNTLIDVHGKMGAWKEAIAVLSGMKSEGVEPVLRTYNTLLIACNMCSQPQEAINIYHRMVEEGFQPNSTTYNALISAYGKSGQLDRVMEIFQEMMYRGCERSVITYSSLISACEKAGQWELALELFQEMIRENCQPNTVTFNSLITALGQGGQWEKTEEIFDQMQAQGCAPDVVTYTAFISALEKGGQWRSALGAFEKMRRQACRADAIVYNAIIDALWETGVVWAQRRALGLLQNAIEEGYFGQTRLGSGLSQAEVNLHAMTAGVAMLSLYSWLMALRDLIVTHGASAIPARLLIVTDRGKTSKEQGNLVVKEAVNALMAKWSSPFKAVISPMHSSGSEASLASTKSNGNGNGTMTLNGILQASGADTAVWLLSNEFEAKLFSFFPCTDILPSVANMGQSSGALISLGALLDDVNHHKEIELEERCGKAFAAVRMFEKTHCLALQNMGYNYLQCRSELVKKCSKMAEILKAPVEAGHDAVLLMDRVMSTSLSLDPSLLDLLASSCVIIAAKQIEGPGAMIAQPLLEDFQAVTGLPLPALDQMEWNVRQILGNDTASISALRCLKLYYERLGAHHMDSASAVALSNGAFDLVGSALEDMAFLNCRPSVIAAAILYVDRRARGVIPFWPTMLAKLTGYQDMSTPELSVAIKAAQRLKNSLRSSQEEALTKGNSGSMRRQNSYNDIEKMKFHTETPLAMRAPSSVHVDDGSFRSFKGYGPSQEADIHAITQEQDVFSSQYGMNDRSMMSERSSSLSSMTASTVSASVSSVATSAASGGSSQSSRRHQNAGIQNVVSLPANGFVKPMAATSSGQSLGIQSFSPSQQVALMALQRGLARPQVGSGIDEIPNFEESALSAAIDERLGSISPIKIADTTGVAYSGADSGSGADHSSGNDSSSGDGFLDIKNCIIPDEVPNDIQGNEAGEGITC